MSWAYAICYIEQQRFVRTKEVTAGDTSIVTMEANPEAHPWGGSELTELTIVLEIVCDSDGKPMSGQLRSV